MTTPLYRIAKHIGFDVTASGQPALEVVNQSGRGLGYNHSPILTIFSEDGADEGAYFPAQCIKVNGKEAITNLRDFCNDLLNEPKP